MPATGISPTLPITRRPAWPMAVDSGKLGILAYGIFVALVNSSAKSPSPEPRTNAMRGRSLVLLRMNLAARSARTHSALAFDFVCAAFRLLVAVMKKFLLWRPIGDLPWCRPASREYRI